MRQKQNGPSDIPSSLIKEIDSLPEEKKLAIRLLIQNIDLVEKMVENDAEGDHDLQKYGEKTSVQDDYFFQALMLYKREKMLQEKEEGQDAADNKKEKPPKDQ